MAEVVPHRRQGESPWSRTLNSAGTKYAAAFDYARSAISPLLDL